MFTVILLIYTIVMNFYHINVPYYHSIWSEPFFFFFFFFFCKCTKFRGLNVFTDVGHTLVYHTVCYCFQMFRTVQKIKAINRDYD